MPKSSPLLNNFNAGELSPLIGARSDLSKYYNGCRTLENFIPMVEGGVFRIPGIYYCAETKDSSKESRLMPFHFSTVQAYQLEFGNQYIRPFKDRGQIGQNITGAANNGVGLIRITVGSAHGLVTGNTVFISGVLGTTEANGFWTVTAIAATTFDLQGSTFTNPYTSGGKWVTEIVSSYLEADLFGLKITQSADVLYITHPGYPSKKLTRTGHTSWTLTDFVAKIQDPFTITAATQANPCVITVTYTDTAWATATAYVVGNIRVNGNYHYYCKEAHTSGTFATDLAAGYWRRMDLPATGDIIYISGVVGMTELNNIFFTCGTVTDGAGTATIQLSGIDSQTYTVYTSGGVAQKSLFGTTDKRPSCVTFFEQRLGLAGSNNHPQRIDLSASGEYEDFTPDPDDASAAISYTLVSDRVDRIRWLLGQDVLLIGTVGGLWRLGASATNDPLSNENVIARKQVTMGAKDIEPEMVGDSILWVTRSGRILRQFVYDIMKERWIAPDMTRIARHIAKGTTLALSGIVDMDFQMEPQPILWSVKADGQLLGLTYETQEDIYAWFRKLGDGKIESVSVIHEDDNEDQVWVIAKRTINTTTKRYIEYFKPHEFFSQIKDCFFVDCGLTYDGGNAYTITGITNANPAVVTCTGHPFVNGDKVKIIGVEGMTEVNCGLTKAYTVANAAANTFQLSGITSVGWGTYISGGTAQKVTNTLSNLNHIEGKEIDILIDGAVQAPRKTVSSGAVTLSWYGNLIHAGLPYTSILEPMKINAPTQSGTARGKKQKITKLWLVFYETRGGKYGPDRNNLDTIAFGTGITPALFTGDKDVDFLGDWAEEATITVVQDQPLPMTVLAMVAEITANER